MKRALILVVVLVALLALAAPALAFNGFRADYTTTVWCQVCHTTSPGTPMYDRWADTKHAVAAADGQATRAPSGSSCAGCHTANYDPGKVSPSPVYSYLPAPSSATPSPVPTKTTTSYVYENAPDSSNATAGNSASSELDVGCSSCHYGVSGPATYGGDASNTAHSVNMQEMANADICGQCHSRYAYTDPTYNIILPTPTSSPTMVQPQYAIGYQMLGNPGNSFVADPLENSLHIPHPGWTPTPNPLATTAAGLMTYWKIGGVDTNWQQIGHDGSAAQYPEWLSEGHANALVDLKAAVPNSVIDGGGCLKCHSADYRNAAPDAKPTAAEAKYGITCVGCHTPHDAGTVKGAWDEAFDAQLIGDSKDLCVTCHTAELDGATATAGTTVHNTMKEMMDGTGAIDVPAGSPSNHKGACIKCHMPPTSYSRGSVQLGGNHTFEIIDPAQAAEVDPFPINTTTPSPSATPVVKVTTMAVMPYSACSTCHGKAGDPLATYLQGTLEDRQASMQERIDAVTAELVAASGRMGYTAGATDALTISSTLTAIAAKPAADRTASDINFQKAYTNRTFVENEGSLGIHNYAYANAVITKALQQAQASRAGLTAITIVPSATALKYGSAVMFSGAISGGTQAGLVGGQVRLWRQTTGSTTWNVVATTFVDGDASNEYEFVITPSRSGTYKAQFTGTDTYEALWSAPTAEVTVAWRVTFKASRTRVRRNTKITYSGAIGPAGQAYALAQYGVGQRVIIQRKSGSTWKTWKSVAVKTNGTYKIVVKMKRRGTFVLRGFFKGDTTHLDGISARKTIRVR